MTDPFPDTGAVYEQVRRAFGDLVAGLPDTSLRVAVPATPAWTVHDVLAHVVGLTADLNALRLPDPDDEGGERFSAEQVASRAAHTIPQLVAEWDAEAAQFEDGLRAFGYEFGSHFVGDLVTHLHDVRSALGLADDADPLAVGIALDHYAGFVDERLTELDSGALAFVAGPRLLTAGRGEPVATLSAEPFELLRCLSARRSLRHIRGLHWTGDGDRAIELLQAVYVAGYAFPPG